MFTSAAASVDLLSYSPKEVCKVHLSRADDFGYCTDCSQLALLQSAFNRTPAEEQQLAELERHKLHAKKQQTAFRLMREHLEEHAVSEREYPTSY